MSAALLRGGPRPPRVSVSFFGNVFDQRPTARSPTWSRLADRLNTFPVQGEAVDKLRLPCWSPATFKPGPSATADCVAEVSCLVLDVDNGVSIEDALRHCGRFTVLLHTSWSHAVEAPRFRIVFPLARPIPGARWSSAWATAVHSLELNVDRNCSNSNRRYLLPARPYAAAAHHVEVRETDLALDLLASLSDPSPRADTRASRSLVVPHHRVDRTVHLRLARDPSARSRLAEALGAQRRGVGHTERVDSVPCPACGRASAWFFIAPERASNARCNHKASCGWSGPVTSLIGRAS